MSAEVSLSCSRAHVGLSSVPPSHSCSSQLQRFGSRSRTKTDCKRLDLGLLGSHRLRVYPIPIPPPSAHSPSYLISRRTFTTRVLQLHPLTGSSSSGSNSNRLNLGLPRPLVHHLPLVLAPHRPQAVLGPQRHLQATGVRQPRPHLVILCCAMGRRSFTPKRTTVKNVGPCPVSLASTLTLHSRCDEVTIRATRTMIRPTRAASAGTASASHLRRFSPRAHGVARAAGLRVRANVAARSSARYPHSSPRRRACHHRHLCQVHILCHLGPQGCDGATAALWPSRMAQCPRQARPSLCPVTHASAGGCAGDVVDAGRPRS